MLCRIWRENNCFSFLCGAVAESKTAHRIVVTHHVPSSFYGDFRLSHQERVFVNILQCLAGAAGYAQTRVQSFSESKYEVSGCKSLAGCGDLIENPYFLAVIGKKMTIFVAS